MGDLAPSKCRAQSAARRCTGPVCQSSTRLLSHPTVGGSAAHTPRHTRRRPRHADRSRQADGTATAYWRRRPRAVSQSVIKARRHARDGRSDGGFKQTNRTCSWRPRCLPTPTEASATADCARLSRGTSGLAPPVSAVLVAVAGMACRSSAERTPRSVGDFGIGAAGPAPWSVACDSGCGRPGQLESGGRLDAVDAESSERSRACLFVCVPSRASCSMGWGGVGWGGVGWGGVGWGGVGWLTSPDPML